MWYISAKKESKDNIVEGKTMNSENQKNNFIRVSWLSE